MDQYIDSERNQHRLSNLSKKLNRQTYCDVPASFGNELEELLLTC